MEELIYKAKNGDEEAFTQLIIQIEQDLYKIARIRLACQDDINDAIQETIIETFKSIKKIKHPQYFKTWVIKVLINKCNKIFRNSKKEEYVEYDEEIVREKYFTNEDNVEDIDFFILIDKLNYKEKITLTLYYHENLTTKEISKILIEPESTIRNRIARAKNKLKKMCEGEVDYGRY